MNNNNSIILIAGFAIFSMFFGSGNLVFPLQIGVESLSNYPWASIGLFLTGIIIPFIGLFSVLIKASTGVSVLTRIGKIPGLILIFMMLSLMGPFGVGARCVLVAYGGMQLIMPDLSHIWFSLGFCSITGYIIWKRHSFVGIIGRYLTPALLIGIFLIIIFGMFFGEASPPSPLSRTNSLGIGILYGYQTMDLLAAFFFSGAALGYLKFAHEGKETRRELIKAGLIASSIGILLLSLVYVGFVALGAKYASYLQSVKPEQMLTLIAGKALGVFAMPVMSMTVMLACLTTLVVLTNLFSEFIHEHIFKEKINIHWSILLTLVITFCVSLFGFKTLAIWIGNSLTIAYPALITLAVTSIIKDIFNLDNKFVQISFYGSLGLAIMYTLFM